MANIVDLVKKELDPADQVKHQYRALYNRKEGFIVLTNNRLTFWEQGGFFRPSYRMTLDIPYEKINTVTTTASHALDIEVEAEKYNFTSLGETNAQVITEEIRALSAPHQG
ncbi:MAG: PH domain-containing protein [Candidatus Bathyarchaeota archaeon]|nr:PH domain-containing protein [Candidatus Bathyarchaeota archaeon]